MTTLRSVNTVAELSDLLAEVGPLVSLSSLPALTGYSRCHAYRLGEEGQVRVYAVDGKFHVPFADVEELVRTVSQETASLLCPAP